MEQDRKQNIAPNSRAIFDLKTDLLAELNERNGALDGEAVVDVQDIDTDFPFPLFDRDLRIEKQPFEVNPLAPTPLDPYNLSVAGGERYFNSAETFMYNQLDEKARQTNIDDTARTAIKREIETQHMMQSTKNAESYKRLRQVVALDPSRLTDDIKNAMPGLRSGLASSESRLQLLSQFPEMIAIEDMKYTCVLDTKGYQRAMDSYISQFMGLQFSAGANFLILPKDKQRLRTVDVSESADSNIVVAKSCFAEVFYQDAAFELIQRRSYYGFPKSPQLRGIPENIVKFIDEEARNLQPIAVSVYIRHKKSEVETPDSNDMYFVNDSMKSIFAKPKSQ